MNKHKIRVHACGGAGISMADKVLSEITALGDGFAPMDINYIDTSISNITKIDPVGEFWHIKTKTHAGVNIAGSGSERKTNLTDIISNVKDYLDKHKIQNKVTGEYHMVIFSASGGSGSVIAPILIKNLLERNIPVFAVVIGDSSNGLSAFNTMNTLASMNGVAVANKKPLSVVYINNHALSESGMHSAEKQANKILFNTISSIALFLSSENEDIDNQDMINMIDQSNYTTVNINPGLYGIAIYSKNIDLPVGATPTGGRTLTLQGETYDTGLTLLHSKKGNVTNENVLSIYKEQFPLHMITYANFFNIEEKALNKVTSDYNTIMESIKSNEFVGSGNSNFDEESGLII